MTLPSQHPGHDEWVARARALAAELASTVVARERANTPPLAQIELLKTQGFSTLLIPREFGGGGARWLTALEVVRELCAADGSLGVLLGYHLISTANMRLPERARQIVEHKLWVAGLANSRDDDIDFVLTPDGSWRLSGRKTFCTGARFADRLVAYGRAPDGQTLTAWLPADRAGISFGQDWDHLGLGRTESGSFTLTDVVAQAHEVGPVKVYDDTDFGASLRTPLVHSMFANYYVGFALGALHTARDYVQTTTRAWHLSPAEKASQDPLVISQFGELWIALQAAIAFTDRAAGKVQALIDAGPEHWTPAQRGEAAIDVAAARTHAIRTGLDVTTRIFDSTGARATSNRNLFDRFWRDLRIHSLHDPVAYKVLEVGEYALNGRHPRVLPYT
jgi:alkylation response protein AidB-like acyl-CoA dehydrogenase